MLPRPVTKETTGELMRQCDLVVATGSQANVRAAYASGTPAFGVGAGNVASIVDETADLADAATKIASRRPSTTRPAARRRTASCWWSDRRRDARGAGAKAACAVKGEDRARLEACMWPEGKLSPGVIGQSVEVIAERAKLTDPKARGARILLVDEKDVGPGARFSGEKLSPVLTVYRVADFAAAAEQVRRIYEYQGAGHSVSLHTKRHERALELGLTLPVARVIVNQVHVVANGGSFTNSLPYPSRWAAAHGAATASPTT
jgi:sulfoacetaldehyde dehydrogenase